MLAPDPARVEPDPEEAVFVEPPSAEAAAAFLSPAAGGAFRAVPAGSSWRAEGLSLAGLAVVFAVMAVRGWRRWPDVLVDFGAQLYTPWQLAQGRHLYADIAWKFGPLSQYWNALLFHCFGVSYTTLMVANLVLLAAATVVLHVFFLRACGRLPAFLAGLTFLVASGFSHLSWRGNWNFVSPYTHEATHGVALAIGAMCAMTAYASRQSRRALAVAGLLIGLALLTKVEIAVAALGGVALLVLLCWERRRPSWRRAGGELALFGGAVLLPVLAAFAILGWVIGPARAAAGLATNAGLAWDAIGRGDHFYREVAGLNDARDNLKALRDMALAWAGALVGALLLDLLLSRVRRWRVGLVVLVGAAALAAGCLLDIPWEDLPRPLPLVTGILLVWGVVRAVRAVDLPAARQAAMVSMWAAFSLAMLMKVVLDSQLSHYGFVHAAPALMLAVAFVLRPGAWGVRLPGDVFRAAMLGLVVAGLWAHATVSDSYLERKSFQLGTGGDAILSYPPALDPTAATLEAAEDELRPLLRPGSSLLVMPEGAMLNYQLRCPNPTPWSAFTPFDLTTYGGDAAVLTGLQSHPPDYIALVQRPMHEYGVGHFGGRRYGWSLLSWVVANYGEVVRLSPSPRRGHAIRIALFAHGADDEDEVAPDGAQSRFLNQDR